MSTEASNPQVLNQKYQIQKLYVRNLSFDKSSNEWESILFRYFSLFGIIIDLKVLQTRSLSSHKGTICVCHVPGGGSYFGGSIQIPYCARPASPIIRSKLHAQKIKLR